MQRQPAAPRLVPCQRFLPPSQPLLVDDPDATMENMEALAGGHKRGRNTDDRQHELSLQPGELGVLRPAEIKALAGAVLIEEEFRHSVKLTLSELMR